jgi:hypothetical protein
MHLLRVALPRLSPAFESVTGARLTAASLAHRLDAHWPLCTLQLRGECHSASCEWQMAENYMLQPGAKLQTVIDLATR